MANISRRRWLAAAFGAAAMAPFELSIARATNAARGAGATNAALSPRRIRYFVQIVLGGGVDQVLTSAPRVAKDVDPGIDVPYKPDAIVQAGKLLLGPHLKPLAEHADRLTLLTGVRTRTAGHPSGGIHLSRLRTQVTNSFPAFVDTFGSYREGTLLGSVSLSDSTLCFAPDALGIDGASQSPAGFPGIEGLHPSDLRALQQVLTREAAQLERLGGDERIRIADRLRATAALYERLPKVPAFQLAKSGWGEFPAFASSLQRALWLIENDLASGLEVVPVFMFWDTHEENFEAQSEVNIPTFKAIAAFIRELAARSNTYGLLIDQTLIVIGSEMGRFPRVNARNGKDHSPEIPLVILDPSRRGGHSFGPLGRQLEAVSLSTKTGHDGTEDPMLLDDVGATLLARFGINPEVHGYTGRHLRFLDV